MLSDTKGHIFNSILYEHERIINATYFKGNRILLLK
jgi:hypothetical protein